MGDDMSVEYLEKVQANNGTVEIAHIVRNGLMVCRKLIKESQKHPEQIVEYVLRVDHRLKGMERSLQGLIDEAKGKSKGIGKS